MTTNTVHLLNTEHDNQIEVRDKSGATILGLSIEEARELAESLNRTVREEADRALEIYRKPITATADHWHVYAIQDEYGSTEYRRGWDDRLTETQARALAGDVIRVDTAYLYGWDEFNELRAEYGDDRITELVSTNVNPGWDGIWVLGCYGPKCRFHDVVHSLPDLCEPYWRPSAPDREELLTTQHRDLRGRAAMKILTITDLDRGDLLWCWAIEGEIATPDIVCHSPGCGCDRSHAGLNSHKASTTLMVRNVDLSFADLVAAYSYYLDESGWAFEDPGQAAIAMANHNVDAAHDHPEGTVLLPLYDRHRGTWRYDELVSR